MFPNFQELYGKKGSHSPKELWSHKTHARWRSVHLFLLPSKNWREKQVRKVAVPAAAVGKWIGEGKGGCLCLLTQNLTRGFCESKKKAAVSLCSISQIYPRDLPSSDGLSAKLGKFIYPIINKIKREFRKLLSLLMPVDIFCYVIKCGHVCLLLIFPFQFICFIFLLMTAL